MPYSGVGFYTYQRLGTWNTCQGGHVLKLSYLHCVGFGLSDCITGAGVVTNNGPQIVDFTIYFYSSSGKDPIVVGPSKFHGYGYAVSQHVTNYPLSVYVTTTYQGTPDINSHPQLTFDFYVQTGWFVGTPVVSVLTSAGDTWTPDALTGEILQANQVVPTNAFRLGMGVNNQTFNRVATNR